MVLSKHQIAHIEFLRNQANDSLFEYIQSIKEFVSFASSVNYEIVCISNTFDNDLQYKDCDLVKLKYFAKECDRLFTQYQTDYIQYLVYKNLCYEDLKDNVP